MLGRGCVAERRQQRAFSPMEAGVWAALILAVVLLAVVFGGVVDAVLLRRQWLRSAGTSNPRMQV